MTDSLLIRMARQIAEWERDEPRDDWWQYQRDHAEAADHIASLEAEVAALRDELQAKKDADLDRHIFAWFNDTDCDEMRRCLDAYNERALLNRGDGNG